MRGKNLEEEGGAGEGVEGRVGEKIGDTVGRGVEENGRGVEYET